MAINIPIISSLEGKGFQQAITQLKALETTSQKAGYIAGKAFLPAVAAMGALTVAAGYSIKAAVEDSAAQAILAKTLQNVTSATDSQIAAIEEQISVMSLATGVADDELRPAFASLVRVTQDVTAATDGLKLAMDISAGTGKDLGSVSDALAKAYGGNYKALGLLSPELKKMIKDGASLDEVMAAMAKTFGGQAAVAAGTAQGQFKRLNVALDEAKESIGMALLPAVMAVLPYLIEFGNWAADHTGTLLAVATTIAAISTALIGFKAAQVIANAVTIVTTALNWSLAASAAAANTALTLGVGAAAIAAGLVVAAGAFMVYKNATKSAVEGNRTFGGSLTPLPPAIEEVDTAIGGVSDKAKKMAERVKEASDALKTYLADALANAQTQLAEAQEAFSDFATNVSDGIKDAFSFQDAKDAGDETGAGFLQGLRDQVAGIVKYGQDVKTLLGMGLSQDALKAVLEAGGESGAAIAAELIKGGATAIQETNALVMAAEQAAFTIGQSAASQWYGAGVSNAQSYLQGVEAAFAAAQAKLGQKGIKLPDIKGIGAGFAEAISPQPVGRVIPKRPGQGYEDFASLTVNVTGGLATSAEVGQAVVNSIRAYNRSAGPANIQVG
jgi:large-conductance mechanosensitive channel